MKKMISILSIITFLCSISALSAYAHCGTCGVGDVPGQQHSQGTKDEEKSAEKGSCFGYECSLAAEKEGVREISYEQFQRIRKSGEKYVLLDVLSAESYEKGHIPGAKNFPYKSINFETAPEKLKKSDNIIVYCGGFKCSASTKAAHRLMALGYENVVDYKGGLGEWREKGNELVN